MPRLITRGRTAASTLLGLALVAASGGAASGGAASAKPPAESTRVLPRLFDTAGAVDGSGGSLVAGLHITGGPDSLYTYHRTSSGRWQKRVEIPTPAGQNAGFIQDIEVIGGTGGFFVISWVYSEITANDDGSPNYTSPVVYAATRLPSGTITTPKLLFETDDYPAISLGGNANGDAALTMDGGDDAARYTRGVGWVPLTLPVEPGSVRRGRAVAMMSPARTVDITYTSPPSTSGTTSRPHVVQQTLTTGSSTFTRRDIYTAPESDQPDFDIAMDSAGLQTLVTDDADDGIKVYRETTRRGTFDYRWRKPNGYRTEDDEGPQVESSGHYTRVTWATRSTLAKQTRYTRAFNGTNWGPSVQGPTYRSLVQPFRLAIASDGTGVEFGGVDADRNGTTHDYVSLGYLHRTTRYDAFTKRNAFFIDALDSNGDGVSQRIDVEEVTVGGQRVERTIVRIRR